MAVGLHLIRLLPWSARRLGGQASFFRQKARWSKRSTLTTPLEYQMQWWISRSSSSRSMTDTRPSACVSIIRAARDPCDQGGRQAGGHGRRRSKNGSILDLIGNMSIGCPVDSELDFAPSIYYQLWEGAPFSKDASRCDSMTDSIRPESIADHDSRQSMRWVFMVPVMIQTGGCPMAIPSPYLRWSPDERRLARQIPTRSPLVPPEGGERLDVESITRELYPQVDLGVALF